MKLIRTISYALLLLSTTIFARNKVVYGVDDRVDPTPSNPYYSISQSTAALIGESALEQLANGDYEITNHLTLEQGMSLCSQERFSNQLLLANCSGALIAPDILITAGHCVAGPHECGSGFWVFNYNQSSIADYTFAADDVYHCQTVLKQALNSENGDDYAVILLDRVVKNHAPLSYRRTGKIADKAPLVVIGHPTGLPTKIAAGAKVQINNNPIYFTADLDTFGGNSGSAVFNTKTKQIEGILVRGATDYVWDDANSCQQVNVCHHVDRSTSGDYTCYGEDVTRITNIDLATVTAKVAAQQREFFLTIQQGGNIDKFIDLNLSPNYTDPEIHKSIFEIVIEQDNITQFKTVAQLKNFAINFTNHQGQSALLYAVKKQAKKMITFLTSSALRLRREYHDINYNIQDDNGNSALHLAVLNRDLTTLEKLLKRNINHSLRNKQGKSALDLAKDNGYSELVVLLSSGK